SFWAKRRIQSDSCYHSNWILRFAQNDKNKNAAAAARGNTASRVTGGEFRWMERARRGGDAGAGVGGGGRFLGRGDRLGRGGGGSDRAARRGFAAGGRGARDEVGAGESAVFVGDDRGVL